MHARTVKKLVVLGTGGTIAGTRSGAGLGGYAAAQLDVQSLLADVPLPAGCVLIAEQVAQVDSKDMDVPVWQALLNRCLHWLGQPDVQGLVITHGTDTAEETAFLLHCLLPQAVPVVLTCAMRPADAPDADGPANLRDALLVAAEPTGRGVVLVCAGRILGARHVRKVHTQRLDALSSGEAGDFGAVVEGRVNWTRPVAASDGCGLSVLPAIDLLLRPGPWPRVEIVFSHAAADGLVVDALLAQKEPRPVQGLVVVATGAGTLHMALEAALQRAQAKGVRVLLSTRCIEGALMRVDAWTWPGIVLTPAKARLALMLSLMAQGSA